MAANNTPQGDYIEQDLDDDRNYCEHGTFIGNPFGGDYLCGYCELGVTAEEYAEMCFWVQKRRSDRECWSAFTAELFRLTQHQWGDLSDPIVALGLQMVSWGVREFVSK